MELMHYTNNDDLMSMGKKNDVNFRRLAVQFDQRIKILMGEIEQLKKRVDELEKRMDAVEKRLDAVEERLDAVEERLDDVEERLDTVEDEIEEIKEAIDDLDGTPPIGSSLITFSYVHPEDLYPDASWNLEDHITTADSVMDVYRRYA